jgi:hypothetical protein
MPIQATVCSVGLRLTLCKRSKKVGEYGEKRGNITVSVRSALTLAMVATVVLVFGIGTRGYAESQPRLKYNFEQGILTEPSSGLRYVVDATGSITGRPHNGYLQGANGGAISLVSNPARGLATKFPEPCSPTATTGCPKAMIQTDPTQSDDLNPRSAPFSFGAVVLMEPSHLSGGSNVVQKGLYNDPEGHWKLQVDSMPGEPGQPSCSVRGVVDGGLAKPVYVKASGVDVADGRWHRIVCRRTADDRLAIIVDGVWKNSEPAPHGALIRNDAPVTVGAKHLKSDDNDQFHGTLNRIFFRLD